MAVSEADKGGTQIRFLFDDTIFAKSVAFDPDTIRSRLRELAFLNNGALIRFRCGGRSDSIRLR
jgi:DNA gyrase subunit B